MLSRGLAYTDLLDLLAERMILISSAYSLLTLPLIRAALQGMEVDPEEKPEGMKLTYRDYVANGYFLDSNTIPTQPFVPRLSPLLMHMYAKAHSNSSNVVVC